MHDVFISYSHNDVQVADAICHKLEEAGVRCWYAPRNIMPGVEWADAIIEALEACQIMVLVFTDYSNSSKQVHREVDTAVNLGKAIIPFKCSDILPSGSMRYYLSTLHWLDAVDAPLESSISELVTRVKLLISQTQSTQSGTHDKTAAEPGHESTPMLESASTPPQSPTEVSAPTSFPLSKQKMPLYAGIAAACVLALVIAIASLSGKGNTASSSDVTQQQTRESSTGNSSADSSSPSSDKTSDTDGTTSADSGEGGANGVSNTGNADSYIYDESNDSPGAENYLYTVSTSSNSVCLDRYFGPEDTTIVIPEIVDGLPVTSIGEKCFEDHDHIEKLVLPKTLEVICYRAFYGCSNLKEMNIPASLTKTLGWSFAHTGFVNVTFPETFQDIDYGTFYGCSDLETVVLSSSCDYLGRDTFRGCGKLISVTIPAENPEIVADAFEPDTDVTIIGVAGSYSERYAKGMGLKFEKYAPQDKS